MAVVIRPFEERDLAEADRVNRLAFGTFFGLAEPIRFRGDGAVIPNRWRNFPAGGWTAEEGGRLAGCIFGIDWGSVVVLGPLTVHPDFWGRGIARRLIPPFLEAAEARAPALIGLFTHPQSPTHIRLYEAFGFRMDRITAVMARPLDGVAPDLPGGARLYSGLGETERDEARTACRVVADAAFAGLDPSGDIDAVARRGLGETVLVEDSAGIAGFALAQHGAGSEGGSANFVIKLAVVRPGAAAPAAFEALLGACAAAAAARGAAQLVAAVSSGRAGAYDALKALGFRTFMNGVTMLRPGDAALVRARVYLLDDWR